MFDRGMFMKSVKSRKMNLLVIRLIVALTGVLMFAFQNCSRINTLQISDIAGKAVSTNQLVGNENADENVNVQIELANGDVLAVDPAGNETVMNNNNSNNNNSDNSNNSNNNGGSTSPGQVVQQPVVEQPILVTGDDGVKVEDVADLDVCVAQEQAKTGDRHHGEHGEDHRGDRDDHRYGSRDDDHDSEHHQSNRNTLASYKRVKCKIKKDKKHDGPRCMDMIRESGMTVIDLAKLGDVSVIRSVKGKTLIMSSDPSITSARGLIIENAVGRTILCGVLITRLDVKKGNLEMREGAAVKSCGEINGRIFKDEHSRIDGSDSE